MLNLDVHKKPFGLVGKISALPDLQVPGAIVASGVKRAESEIFHFDQGLWEK